jgi:Zn-dependent membrane protease YugP
MALVPVTQIASVAWQGILIAGLLFHLLPKLLGIAIAIFTITAFFQLVTLPVEIDASRRAKRQLVSLGLVRGEEATGVSKVLSAAAMTYVAALVSGVLTLLQFILIARDRD